MNSKYLKYAIGEIVLVVIGILIALSINNWNEKRKDRAIEEQIISEMLTSLKSDGSRFKFLNDRISQKDSAIQLLYNLRESEKEIEDGQIEALLNKAGQGISLSFDTGPYQALISLGINKMSNKALLKDVIYYYNVRLPRAKEFIEEAVEYYEQMSMSIMQEAFNSELLSNEVIKNTEGKWIAVRNNKTQEILNSEFFKDYTVTHLAYAALLTDRMWPLMRNNETLIEKLENY